VPLADVTTTAGVWGALATALKIQLNHDPVEQLCQDLRTRGPTLLILDNFEQIVQRAEETVGRLLDTVLSVQIVATSREPLRLVGELIYALELLSASDAIELFANRAVRANRHFQLTDGNRRPVQQLVERLDCLPLAIELAAARSRMLSPQKLLERLSRRFDLLKSRAPEVPQRQRTLRNAIQWSWELLNGVERAVLIQCSIFEGGMTLEAAEAIIDVGDDGVWVDEVLAELIDKSMLTQHKERLSMLVSIQQFVQEQAAELIPHHRRHAQYFGTLFPMSQGGFNRLKIVPKQVPLLLSEKANLLVAVKRACEQGWGDIALQCVCLLYTSVAADDMQCVDLGGGRFL